MTVTVEKSSATFDTDCVKLTAAERYVMEAGAYLAYVGAESGSTALKLGQKIVAMTPDASNLEGYTSGDSEVTGATDFTPDVNGLYVFRRSIDVSNDRTETFEYAGYYYNDGEFYKVQLSGLTADTVADYANDGVKSDGNLSAATATYFKETTEVANPVGLTYDATNHRLVATYDTGVTSATDLTTLARNLDTAERNLAEAEAALLTAAGDNTDAASALKKAIADYNAADAALTAANAGKNSR